MPSVRTWRKIVCVPSESSSRIACQQHVSALERVRITTEALAAVSSRSWRRGNCEGQSRASGSASSSSPAPFVQPCSCLVCWQGRKTDQRDRATIKMGHAAYLGEDGYMKEDASDQSQCVRCVTCCECNVGRWYLREHMATHAWWNPEYWAASGGTPSNPETYYCNTCWARKTA